MNDGEERMEAALRPFGWTCGPEFWQRYHTDPWVFNLANAVERLTARVAMVEMERDLLAPTPEPRGASVVPEETQ